MGRLEDELERLRAEVESLDAARLAYGQGRNERLHELICALREGRDTASFNADDVERVSLTLQKIAPAVERVLERLAEKGGHIGEDGSWRPDEHV